MKRSYFQARIAPSGRIRFFRLGLGILLFLAGAALLLIESLAALTFEPSFLRALGAGGLCALGTALGALPVLVMRSMPAALTDALLGVGAGVMLAATAFSLVTPGLEAARDVGFNSWAAGALISVGMLFGALCLLLVGLKFSGASPQALVGVGSQPMISVRIRLFVIAIVADNIPEGMAIGVAAGSGMSEADSLAIGIALQNVPEGLVIALVLAWAGMPRFKAFLIGAASGLVEPLAAVICAWLVNVAQLLLPLGLACAAGAMLLVVTQEIVPESRSNGHHRLAGLGLCIGFCLMMVLDTAMS